MLKKIGVGFGILVGMLAIIVAVLVYSNDSLEVVLSDTPESKVTEADFLTRSQVGNKTVLDYPLTTTHGFTLNQVVVGLGKPRGNEGVFVKATGSGIPIVNDDRTLAALTGSDFHNGTIEVELNSTVSSDVSRLVKMFARGFAGVCFRVSLDFHSFECMYLRPENGNAEDEARRNHAVQYISGPDWDFARLRKEAPEKYENPANIAPGKWHKIRIEVLGTSAKLFIDDGKKPVLIVDDMKLGENANGSVALWVGPGTNAFFRNLKITKLD